jgi:hypothetical protein
LAGVKLAGGVKQSEAPQSTGGFWGILGSAATKVSALSNQVLGTAEVRDPLWDFF